MSLPAGPAAIPVPSLALVILDGWGLAPAGPGNAVSLANTPVFDELWTGYPHTQLSASGRDVGLPDGQMGNSEVGHLNLGAGAVVKQDLARIDESIADGSFFENPALLAACDAARRSPRGRLHLMGLVSDGGVHSGWEHLEACIELAAQEGVPDLVLHAFTDGRDTLPRSSPGYLEEVERWLRQAGRVGTVSGRYYAMDRDRRWERTKLAYDAIVHARGATAPTAAEAVAASHEADETDEFVRPTVIGAYDGIADGDVAIHFNFRPDRARQLVRALAEPGFDEFPRGPVSAIQLTTLAEYREGWPYPVAFPPKVPATTLAEVLAGAGARQLHVAETEKYAHVTYFFNGGREQVWEGEERCLVDSPRDVPTYDHKPEMSARAAAGEFAGRWSDGRLPVRDPQLRQPGHGRPHRRDPRCGRRDRGRRRVPRAGGLGGARLRGRLHGHRRSRQRRQHARARRLAEHGALHQPRAADRDRERDRAGRGGHPRGRRANGPAPARNRPADRDDRALVAGMSRGSR